MKSRPSDCHCESIKLLKNIHDTIKWRVNGCANGMLSDSKDFMSWDEILTNIKNHVK
jgi:hypothetical protein